MRRLNTRNRRPLYPFSAQVRPRVRSASPRRAVELGLDQFVALCEFWHEATGGHLDAMGGPAGVRERSV